MTHSADTFLISVREALKHYADAAWLGDHSPLATPYFLGARLDAREARRATAVGRGEALQEALFEAAISLWPGVPPQSRAALWDAVQAERMEMGCGGPRYLFLTLDLRYLRRFYGPRTPPTAVGAMYDLLTVSESSFFRHLQQASAALAQALLALVRPSLRLERPSLAAPLIGREATLAGLLADLRARRDVYLSGPGGIGKSSLGTAVLQAWQPRGAFWYTIRPGLNDDLTSILFALGHFLRGQGRSALWLQLVAAQGQFGGVEQALGLLRSDLAVDEAEAFLLCFDEVDLLLTQVTEARHGAHRQILEFLDGLRALTPLLLIGQRALLDTAVHVRLQPLSETDVQALLARAGAAGAAAAAEVHEATGGNPRLVELVAALLREEGQAAPPALRRKPALRPLFHRLWKRLERDEKAVLGELAVFRAAAPPDLWQSRAGLAALKERGLVREDAFGGLALLPAFRELVDQGLPPGSKQQAHRQAAEVRARYGQYTAAAYHLVQAGELETAVALWFAAQDAEIAQGSAGAAYALFGAVAAEDLSATAARRLRVIQNRLYLLAGELENVLQGMEGYSWHAADEVSATAFEQWGDALRMLGEYDESLARYDRAIEVLGQLTNRISELHVKRAKSWALQGDLAGAEREALRAQNEVVHYQGILAMTKGRRREGVGHFQQALDLAEAAADEERAAEAHYRLAYAHGDLGEMDAAEEHAALAAAYYERVGDRLKLEGLRAELAGTYFNIGEYEKVIAPSLQALRFFEQVGHAQWQLVLSNNLAEAYFELGDVAQADVFARRVVAGENPVMLPYGYYTLGRVAAARGDAAAAAELYAAGMQWAQRNDDAFMVAYFHRVYGMLLLEGGRGDEGRGELGRARDKFAELGIAHEVAQTEALLAA